VLLGLTLNNKISFLTETFFESTELESKETVHCLSVLMGQVFAKALYIKLKVNIGIISRDFFIKIIYII